MSAKPWALAALALVAGTVALHWPPAETEFNLDDLDFVAENASIRSPATALAALLRSFPPGQNGRALYRPLTNASHALEWPWFGEEARGYAAVNALLYGGVVALLFALLCSLRLGAPAAFAGALLFAAHPVHSEAVDSIAGRSELLALGFSLACLLAFDRALYARGESRPRETLALAPTLVAIVLFAAAALSKETGVVTGGLLALQLGLAHAASPQRVSLRRAALDLTPFAILAAGILLVRFGVLGRFSPDPSTHDWQLAGGFERLATFGAVYLEYARLLIWPDVLQIDFYYERRIGVRSALDARVLGGWALLALSLAGIAVAARRWLRGARDPHSPLAAAGFGGAMFLLFLLPVSHAVDIGALMAERFLFAPSAGLALVVAAALAPLASAPRPTRAAALLGLALVACAFAVRGHARAAEWRSANALWSTLVRDLPDDARGWTSLSAVRIGQGDLPGGEAALERARAIAPDNYGVRLNTAELQRMLGNAAEAERLYLAMTRSGGVDHNVWLNLARIAAGRGHLGLALERAQQALESKPNHSPSHELIAQLEAGLERRRAYLAVHRGRLATSEDRMELDSIAGACRAIGDRECERAARRRSRALGPRPSGSD
jgi:tetratricopeptide (TPR) repeat protein